MMRSLLKPRWFFAGVAVGFTLCAVLGRVVSRHNFYTNFVRFNPFINASGAYYPTIEQMRQIVLAQCPRDRILVIIGGDSIFHGCGQPDSELWTKSLQEKLGDRYRVFNFALPGSPSPGPSILAAQSLTAIYPRMLFCCNIMGDNLKVLNNDPAYRYLFWDAYYKKTVQMSPPQLAGACLTRGNDKATNEAILTARASCLLDSWFYFRDLWDFIGYRYLFTVWNIVGSQRGISMFRPRMNCKYEYTVQTPAERLGNWLSKEAHYSNFTRGQGAYFDRIVGKDPEGHWIEKDRNVWEAFGRTIQLAIPAELRERTLLVHIPINPWLTRRFLSAKTQESLLGVEELAAKRFEASGCTVARRDDMKQEDYWDNGHLVPQGGEKVAELAATWMREMSARLGYLNAEPASNQ